MADRYRDDRDTNYFRESYGSQDANRDREANRDRDANRDTGAQRFSGYGNDNDTRRGYGGYEGRDYDDRYSDRGERTVQGSGAQGRNWAERTGDEVRSWVGDSDAERRREQDRQQIGRYPGENPGERRYGASDNRPGYGDRDRSFGDTDRFSGGSLAGYGSQNYGGGDYGSSRYSQGQGYGGRTAPTAVTYSDDYARSDNGRRDDRGSYDRASVAGAYGPSNYDQNYSARSSSYTPSSYSAYDDRGRTDRGPISDYNPDERGFLAKAGDEVKSWFGDGEAERRRELDSARTDATTAFSGGSDGRDGDPSFGYTGGTSAYSPTTQQHDPHYAAYRQARVDEYDRDYNEYRQSKQKDFHEDFHNWRSSKSGASTAAAATGMAAGAAATAMTGASSQVKEHQVVVGSDGQGLGKVDHVLGSDIKLTKHDSSDGKHHLIPLSWVASIEGDKVKLSKTSDEAMREWRVADGDQNKTSTSTTQA